LERPAIKGDSPVCENDLLQCSILSRTSHVKRRLNMGGPPSKAKYSTMTDSEPVP